MTVQVSADPALAPVPASQADSGGRPAGRDRHGRRHPGDPRAGQRPRSFPPAGMSIVGVGLPSAQMPGEPLLAGDRVRVVATPGASGRGHRRASR